MRAPRPAPTRRAPTTTTLRLVGAAEVARGVLLLTAGRQIWTAVAFSPPEGVDEVAMRVLGGRELAQGLLQLVRPGMLRRFFLAVDLLHALSMVALGSLDARRRRPALLTGCLALAGATVTWRAG